MFLIASLWEIVQQDWLFYLLDILLFGVAILVTWLYSRMHQLKEIAQMKTQLTNFQNKQSDKMFALEDEYKIKGEKVRLILKDLRDKLLADDVDMVRARRNELSNVFVLEYTKSMARYARLADQLYDGDPKAHHIFLEDHVLPFLQKSGDILELLNQGKVRGKVSGKTISFNYMDFDFAFDFIRKELGVLDFGLRAALQKHAKRLGFSQEL